MKIVTVVGVRPQFIKAATVSRVIAARDDVQEVLVHTGQHYDDNMSQVFFDELSIPKPDYHLNIGSASHGQQTGSMLAAIEEVLLKEKPDCLLVYGDTNSTLAGALAAAKLHIPVAHVEAGLRSFNRKMPEEINRVMTDHVSEWLFTPTDFATSQLQKEGIAKDKIHQVGDVMYDAVLFYNERNTKRETIVEKKKLSPKSYTLVTIHRAENTDDKTRMSNIAQALVEHAQNTKVIFPLHPRTRGKLEALDLLNKLERSVALLEPVGYLDMLALEAHANLIVTDSGGAQKEAYFNQVPCITLRDETEWVELVEAAWNRLCSPNTMITIPPVQSKNIMSSRGGATFYGDGGSAPKLVEIVLRIQQGVR